MFGIFKKRSEVVLDCFTHEYNAYDCYKVDYSRKFIPKWWKDLPHKVSIENEFVDEIPVPNMRGCAGFIDFYNEGIIIPLWTDIIIKTSETSYGFQSSDQKTTCEEHSSSQYNHAFNFFFHLKILSVWMFKCKDPVEFLWTSPFWSNSHNENFSCNVFTVPGLVNFQHQSATSINLFLTKKPNKIFLEAGMPLIYMLPKTEKKIILKHHILSNDEFQKYKSNQSSFNFSFLKRKKYASEKNKCPF